MTTGRVLRLLAVAAGLTVANLYYSQPLLAVIGRSLGASARASGLISTATQIGYAVGMLLLVPLGDSHERRRLMVMMTAVSAIALLGVAASPSLAVMLATSLLLGAASIVPQLAVPFAAALVDARTRGRSVGLVMSGLLVGILLSRSASGFVAAHTGWRVTYVGAAVLMVVLAVILRMSLPRQEPSTKRPYVELLQSLPRLIRDEPILRRHTLLGACTFAAFSVFWTTLAFRLAQLGYGSDVAGLFGIVGVAGAIAAPLAGRLADRYGPTGVNLGAIVAVLLSFGLLWLGRSSLVGLGTAVVVLDFGVQANHISNQTRVLGLSAELRNRLNTVYMVGYFAGGALGSTVGAATFTSYGWSGVCIAGAGCAFAALVVWRFIARSRR